jgi:hypothetical protein
MGLRQGRGEVISGPFKIDWVKEDLERSTLTIIKNFNAEIHSQSDSKGILDLKARHGLRADEIHMAFQVKRSVPLLFSFSSLVGER